MAADDEAQPSEDDVLPDERAAIAERVDDLDELDDEYLRVEDVAADLDIDLWGGCHERRPASGCSLPQATM